MEASDIEQQSLFFRKLDRYRRTVSQYEDADLEIYTPERMTTVVPESESIYSDEPDPELRTKMRQDYLHTEDTHAIPSLSPRGENESINDPPETFPSSSQFLRPSQFEVLHCPLIILIK